jgi:hypothetical protein
MSLTTQYNSASNIIEIKHKSLCKFNNCESKGNANYIGYCARCFGHLFPDDPKTIQIRNKSKELMVRCFINNNYEGFSHDIPLWYKESCDCSTKRRIDHRKIINGTLLAIETDENQHKYYSQEDEHKRYNELFEVFGGKLIFIRFNPDTYINKNNKICNPFIYDRLPILKFEIDKQIERITKEENTELLEVIELFFDKNKSYKINNSAYYSYKCKFCDKSYSNRGGLHKHNKVCKYNKNISTISTSSNLTNDILQVSSNVPKINNNDMFIEINKNINMLMSEILFIKDEIIDIKREMFNIK